MALDIRLEAKLSQSLVMTPRLQQAIKLLQYSHLEMVEHVQEAMLENPTLEAVPDSEGNAVSEREQAIREDARKDQNDLHEQQNGEGESSVDWEKFLEQMANQGSSHLPSTGGGGQDDLPPIETNLTYGESLSEHLLWQLHMQKCGDDEVAAATEIIGNLDDRGYLEVSLEEIAESSGVDEETARDALELVQSFDPLGCGARSLSECLVVQARHHHPEDDTFAAILTDHLGNLERRNYQAIARDLELELEDVVEYHKMIVELEPHPGRGYSGSDARYITPDIYVAQHDGEWVVLLNEDGMPDLRISRYYQKVMANATKADKEYILDKLRGAEFLIKSINKRRKTIRRVMESILKFQTEFFERGVQGLKPMVLQDVADDIEVHMSTVSRVTSNKYVHTPHGIYELKYFFTAGVRQQTGGDMSGEAIKERIKTLVASENPKKPLSDQAIANALGEDGVRVARRTVAKYREALGILPSSKRKNLF